MRSVLMKEVLFVGLSAAGSALYLLPYLTINESRSVSVASSQ
jgi:hypothetical protein